MTTPKIKRPSPYMEGNGRVLVLLGSLPFYTSTMPRSAKEQVDITALLQGILNGYPGNTAIFREYLQNSDDARATKQACSSIPMFQILTLNVRRPLRFSRSTSSNIRLKVYAIPACAIVRDQRFSLIMTVSYQSVIGRL